jgi:phage-related baseplate assembly protein
VDDDTGLPNADLLTQVYRAIENVRPLAVTFGVFAPEVVTVTIAMRLQVEQGPVPEAVQSAVKAALRGYIDALGLGQSLAWSRLNQLAYDASPQVTNVTHLLVNGTTRDVTVTVRQTIKAGVITLH